MSDHRHSLGVYEDILNQLKAKGIRLTESRKAIIRYLMMSDQHPITDYYLPIPSFKEEVESQTGFRITREQMILHGVCPNCQ